MTDSSNAAAGPTASEQSSAKTRQIVLVALLLLMLGALWYDYKVARPAVENAYDRIAALNEKVNSAAGKAYMTEKEVQQELNRTPMHTYTDGDYFVEVYGWRSGLPVKTHNYYAIYDFGPPHIFLTHSKNVLDPELIGKVPAASQVAELPANPIVPPGGGSGDLIPLAGVPSAGGPEGPGEGGLPSGGRKRGKKKGDNAVEATDSAKDPAADPAADSPAKSEEEAKPELKEEPKSEDSAPASDAKPKDEPQPESKESPTTKEEKKSDEAE